MTREILKKLERDQLFTIAAGVGIESESGVLIDDLLDEVYDFFEEEKIDREQELNLASRMGLRKFIVSPEAELSHSFTPKKPLPKDYQVDFIHLIQRDPAWVFLYWEISQETLRNYEGEEGWFSLVSLEKNRRKNISDITSRKAPTTPRNLYLNIGEEAADLQVRLCFRYIKTKKIKIISSSNKLVFTKSHTDIGSDAEFVRFPDLQN